MWDRQSGNGRERDRRKRGNEGERLWDNRNQTDAIRGEEKRDRIRHKDCVWERENERERIKKTEWERERIKETEWERENKRERVRQRE